MNSRNASGNRLVHVALRHERVAVSEKDVGVRISRDRTTALVPDVRVPEETAKRLVIVRQILERVEIQPIRLLDDPRNQDRKQVLPRMPLSPVGFREDLLVQDPGDGPAEPAVPQSSWKPGSTAGKSSLVSVGTRMSLIRRWPSCCRGFRTCLVLSSPR